MDIYAQYARWRRTTRYSRVGLGNRRLAAMLGDFLYESSSAEDESRRILEWLYKEGLNALRGQDLKDLERFAVQNDGHRAVATVRFVSWNRIDELSKKVIEHLGRGVGRAGVEFDENRDALDRLFSTTRALRSFRNQVDHRGPSDNGGRLHFYQDAESEITVSAIWGWTEVAASYWTNLSAISDGIQLATGISLPTQVGVVSALHWPPEGLSIHGLRVLEHSGIKVPEPQVNSAKGDWNRLVRRWTQRR